MESYRCYPQDQVEGILAMTNKKDPETSAISIYDAFDPVETDVEIHKPHDIKECYEVFAKNNVADRDFCIEHTSTKDDRK
jgi:hypothetical protein